MFCIFTLNINFIYFLSLTFVSEQTYRSYHIDNNNSYSDDIYDKNNDHNAYYISSLISIIIFPIKHNWYTHIIKAIIK